MTNNPTPIDHLGEQAGMLFNLLGALSDEQLAEQIAYYEMCQMMAGSSWAKANWDRLLSTAIGVQEGRLVS